VRIVVHDRILKVATVDGFNLESFINLEEQRRLFLVLSACKCWAT
jgi:hypothetical protein